MKNILVLCAFLFSLSSCGWYNDWSRGQTKKDAQAKGEAALMEAQSSKKVAIETAKANLESAKLNAEADSIRAIGIAKANRIIGTSLENNRAYLEWLWIDNIEKNPNQVFYVPTENKVPIFANSNHTPATSPLRN
jgi:regulator of protease activity HflC (stomatin/prohibitin superfamily)